MEAGNSQSAASESEMYFEMQTEFIDAEEMDLTEIAEDSTENVEYSEEYIEQDDKAASSDAIEISGEVQYNESDLIEFDAESNDDKNLITLINFKRDGSQNEEQEIIKRKVGRPRLNSTEKKKMSKKPTLGLGRGRKKLDEEPASIMCEICGNIYTKRSLLNMHMRRHLSDKPFDCE